MLYTRQTFTCPAASAKTTNRAWDLATLSKEEFKTKYGVTEEEYITLTQQ